MVKAEAMAAAEVEEATVVAMVEEDGMEAGEEATRWTTSAAGSATSIGAPISSNTSRKTFMLKTNAFQAGLTGKSKNSGDPRKLRYALRHLHCPSCVDASLFSLRSKVVAFPVLSPLSMKLASLIISCPPFAHKASLPRLPSSVKLGLWLLVVVTL